MNIASLVCLSSARLTLNDNVRCCADHEMEICELEMETLHTYRDQRTDICSAISPIVFKFQFSIAGIFICASHIELLLVCLMFLFLNDSIKSKIII
jgi:hypothetical protein